MAIPAPAFAFPAPTPLLPAPAFALPEELDPEDPADPALPLDIIVPDPADPATTADPLAFGGATFAGLAMGGGATTFTPLDPEDEPEEDPEEDPLELDEEPEFEIPALAPVLPEAGGFAAGGRGLAATTIDVFVWAAAGGGG